MPTRKTQTPYQKTLRTLEKLGLGLSRKGTKFYVYPHRHAGYYSGKTAKTLQDAIKVGRKMRPAIKTKNVWVVQYGMPELCPRCGSSNFEQFANRVIGCTRCRYKGKRTSRRPKGHRFWTQRHPITKRRKRTKRKTTHRKRTKHS